MLIPDEFSPSFYDDYLIKLASGLAFFSQIKEIKTKGYEDVEKIFGKISGQSGNFREFVTDSIEASFNLQDFAEEVLVFVELSKTDSSRNDFQEALGNILEEIRKNKLQAEKLKNRISNIEKELTNINNELYSYLTKIDNNYKAIKSNNSESLKDSESKNFQNKVKTGLGGLFALGSLGGGATLAKVAMGSSVESIPVAVEFAATAFGCSAGLVFGGAIVITAGIFLASSYWTKDSYDKYKQETKNIEKFDLALKEDRDYLKDIIPYWTQVIRDICLRIIESKTHWQKMEHETQGLLEKLSDTRNSIGLTRTQSLRIERRANDIKNFSREYNQQVNRMLFILF